MLPAQERLHPHHSPARHAVHGLVVQPQLLALERIRQLRDHRGLAQQGDAVMRQVGDATGRLDSDVGRHLRRGTGTRHAIRGDLGGAGRLVHHPGGGYRRECRDLRSQPDPVRDPGRRLVGQLRLGDHVFGDCGRDGGGDPARLVGVHVIGAVGSDGLHRHHRRCGDVERPLDRLGPHGDGSLRGELCGSRGRCSDGGCHDLLRVRRDCTSRGHCVVRPTVLCPLPTSPPPLHRGRLCSPRLRHQAPGASRRRPCR